MRSLKQFTSSLLILSILLSMPVYASAAEIEDGDLSTASTITLIPGNDDIFIMASTYSLDTDNAIQAEKVCDGVYEDNNEFYAQCGSNEFVPATKVSIDLSNKVNIENAAANYEINENMLETLNEVADSIEAKNLSTCEADIYLTNNWVNGYQNRQYRSEYLSFRNSTEWVTIKSGFNTAVLESAATMAIGFASSGLGNAISLYQILRDAFYDPTISGSNNAVLQFQGDWGIVLVYTYIKATNGAEGGIGDALLRSIESIVQVNHFQFNAHNPGGNPANTSTPVKSGPVETSPSYNSTSARQKICYDRRLETMPLDNTPTTISVKVNNYKATINATKGMIAV